MLGVLLLLMSLAVLVGVFLPTRNTLQRPALGVMVLYTIISPLPVEGPPHIVELEWPKQLKVSDSDVVRLSLLFPTTFFDEGDFVIPVGYALPPAEEEGRLIVREQIEIPNEVFEDAQVNATARLDSAGLEIDRPGDWEQQLHLGEDITWKWTLAAREAGQQHANLTLTVHFSPRSVGEIIDRTLLSETLAIQTTTALGISGPMAQALALLGSIVGAVLSFPIAQEFWNFFRNRFQGKQRNGSKDKNQPDDNN